jgi:NAD(P)-dependent dehydrogenase (short-subunit alcohol dehydrogenase family)
LIIGGSSGIGRALSVSLSQENQVFATYRNNPVDSAEIRYFFHDVNEALDVSQLPETLDGLCYCPGSIVLKPFQRMKPEQFTEDYQLQLVGAVRVIQDVLPRLKASGNASIVLFSTVAVQTGFNFHSVVSASKGALEGLTRALAAEFAPGIRVNCIAPSLTQTPLASKMTATPEKVEAHAQRHPMKRIGQAKDIAETAAFLLGSKSSWMTGQVIHLDGGMSSLRV